MYVSRDTTHRKIVISIACGSSRDEVWPDLGGLEEVHIEIPMGVGVLKVQSSLLCSLCILKG